MTAVGQAEPYGPRLEQILESVDPRTRETLERRRRELPRRRGWLVRRALMLADVGALTVAFAVAAWTASSPGAGNRLSAHGEAIAFLVTLPAWIALARLHGLYERDEERADHSTADEVTGLLHLVTIGTWGFFALTRLTGIAHPDLTKLAVFWSLALALMAVARSIARAACRRSHAYLQNTIIVGAGDVGQLVARKLVKHSEYGLNVVGFVDDRPRPLRPDIGHISVLGSPAELADIVSLLDVERVILAFSSESEERTIDTARSLRHLDVQVDVVPRLFELVGPRVDVHTIEGLPLVGLSPVRASQPAMMTKRALDIVGAAAALVVAAPLFAYVAWRIRRDSPGPVFFRQQRLGLNGREFTLLKFRTMKVGTSDSEHRAYIAEIMSSSSATNGNGMYKLDRSDAITPFGRWLRRTSLDELPQLINVLRGEMSLVGPRPCLAYETENFAPHHFERFNVPAGVTGLWQVAARAHSSFGEALEMDVAYARGWSLGLDLRLLLRTPLQLIRQKAATA